MFRVLSRLILVVSWLHQTSASAESSNPSRDPQIVFNEDDGGQEAISTNLVAPPWTPAPLDRASLNTTLLPLVYGPLPFGTIKPQGWMLEEMRFVADSLPIEVRNFYEVIKDSRWASENEHATATAEDWPQWYDAMVSLAYGLDDSELKSQVLKLTEFIIERQFEDGWFGPEKDVRQRNFGGRYPFMTGLMQLLQVEEVAVTSRVFLALKKYIDRMLMMLEDDLQGYVSKPGDDFDDQYGRAHVSEMLLFLEWLYEVDSYWHHPIVHHIMTVLYEKSYDWSRWPTETTCFDKDMQCRPKSVLQAWLRYMHVGDVAGITRALQYVEVAQRLTHNISSTGEGEEGFRWSLERRLYSDYPDSQQALIQSGDTNAMQCAGIETMLSLNSLYQATGNNNYAEKAEFAAFGVLPTIEWEDLWRQQAGQDGPRIYKRVDASAKAAHLVAFGNADPQPQCYRVGLLKGWPKLLASSWLKSADQKELIHATLVPSEVQVTFSPDLKVNASCDTMYPVQNVLTYSINTTNAFTFKIRQPSWAHKTSVRHWSCSTGQDCSASGWVEDEVPPPWNGNGFVEVQVESGETRIVVDFGVRTHFSLLESTFAIYVGSLRYFVSVPEPKEEAFHPHGTSRRAFAVDPSTFEYVRSNTTAPDFDGHTGSASWFPGTSPYFIKALACELLDEKSLMEGHPDMDAQPKYACIEKPSEVLMKPFYDVHASSILLQLANLVSLKEDLSATAPETNLFETELKL